MFSRIRLKWGMAGCLLTLGAVVLLHAASTYSSPIREAFLVLETGSAVCAVAIGLLLVATS